MEVKQTTNKATLSTTKAANDQAKEPLIVQPDKYRFKFSTDVELTGKPSICRVTTITLLVVTSICLPILSLYNILNPAHQFIIPIYAWVIYVFVFNTVFIIMMGKLLTSSIAYPYSNSCFTKHLKRTTNQRFGLEFRRCVERMTRMIKETTERQNYDRASEIMAGKDDEDTETDMFDEENMSALGPKDIYMRVASNLELIELYTFVNEQLIQDNPRGQSALFRRATTSLSGIKQTLDLIEVKISFQHVWFPQGKFISYWAFFNRYNLETEKKDQAINIKKFFLRYSSPQIPQTESNLKNLQRLILLTDEFTEAVNQSIRKCCCLFSCGDTLFGRNDQAKLILKKTFEGKQYDCRGPDGNIIDCMFFPCTQKEEVVLLKQSTQNSVLSVNESDIISTLVQPEYINKPTVLMCSPNALIYQQMVIAPNAYWLNFFLKRDINVICWNYRGYGESQIGYLDFLSPSKAKRDAERVLAGSIEALGLKGKIGIYGRSIGGITATHLAAQYNDLVEVLIIDRSLNELEGVAESKLRGSITTKMFKQFAKGWVCKNSENYLKANKCFKIITCDPLDDTIDQFVSTMAGVGQQAAREDYNHNDYQLFFQSLMYICDLEDSKFINRDWEYNEYQELIVQSVKKIEKLKAKSQDVFQDVLDAQNESKMRVSRVGSLQPFNLNFLNQRKAQIMDQDGPFYDILYMLALMVSDLQAATVQLREVIGVIRQPNYQEFKLFLQLAEVFGGGYQDDVDYTKFNLRQTETHRQTFQQQLEYVIKAYDMALVALDLQKKDNLIGNLVTYHDEFVRFIFFQQKMFRKLLAIQQSIKEDVKNDFQKTIEGHLVQFACGHRGQPSRIEEKRISRLLRKSGFIPMLEDIPLVPIKQQDTQKAPQKQQKTAVVQQKPVEALKIVGGGSLPKIDKQTKQSIVEELKVSDVSKVSQDDFDRAGQDSDEEKFLEDKIEIEIDNESLNNSFAGDNETNNLRKEKENFAVSVALQANDTMFFGLGGSPSNRQTYIPIQNKKQITTDLRQRQYSVAQFKIRQESELDKVISESSDKRSRNMSVASFSVSKSID